MPKRKEQPQTVRELLEQWPRAKRSTAKAGTTSLRTRGPKKRQPHPPKP